MRNVDAHCLLWAVSISFPPSVCPSVCICVSSIHLASSLACYTLTLLLQHQMILAKRIWTLSLYFILFSFNTFPKWCICEIRETWTALIENVFKLWVVCKLSVLDCCFVYVCVSSIRFTIKQHHLQFDLSTNESEEKKDWKRHQKVCAVVVVVTVIAASRKS